MDIISLKYFGYPSYAIREDGAVINTKRISIVKPCITQAGYARVMLYKADGSSKKEFIHRLVALAFVSNLEGKPFVNHKNSNKLDNSITNLEWVTSLENTKHSWETGTSFPNRKKVTEDQLKLIANKSMPLKQVSELTGLSKGLISYHRKRLL